MCTAMLVELAHIVPDQHMFCIPRRAWDGVCCTLAQAVRFGYAFLEAEYRLYCRMVRM